MVRFLLPCSIKLQIMENSDKNTSPGHDHHVHVGKIEADVEKDFPLSGGVEDLTFFTFGGDDEDTPTATPTLSDDAAENHEGDIHVAGMNANVKSDFPLSGGGEDITFFTFGDDDNDKK